MSETVIFRGSYIRSMELRNGESDRHCRINITADWSDTVREAMGWGEVPEGFGSADLSGRLAASHLILTPASKELRRNEMQINAEEVHEFEVRPLKDSKGEPTGRELRFMVTSAAPDTAAKVEAYCAVVGRGLAALKVSYVKQDELPLADSAEVLDVHRANLELIELA